MILFRPTEFATSHPAGGTTMRRARRLALLLSALITRIEDGRTKKYACLARFPPGAVYIWVSRLRIMFEVI
jgi:hypothetical protein